jgi:hopanoid biosynthesis associated RND transporter like protein HpnN
LTSAKNPPDRKPSVVVRVMLWLISQAYHRTFLVLLIAFGMFIWSMLYAAVALEFRTDRSSLVDQKEHMKILDTAFQREFPNNQDVVVLIEGGTTQDRESFVDALSYRLRPRLDLYRDVFGKVDLPFLKTHALQYLPPQELKKIVASLREARPMLSALGSQAGVGAMLASSSHDLSKMLPMLNGILAQLLESLEKRGDFHYHSPWEQAFFSGAGGGDAAQSEQAEQLKKSGGKTSFYNTLDGGKQNLLVLRPNGDVPALLDNLYAEISKLRPTYPDLDVGVTGSLVLDLNEMQSSLSDSCRAAVWSFVLIGILFFFSFRNLARPVFALISLAVALGWTLGYTTLAIGHLNLLTVTFATMLIGLGNDFGIHFIFGYEEQRAQGLEPLAAMQETVVHAGTDGFTGAFTTCIAFYAIRMTSFRGIAELGAIAGTGVLLCFLAMVTVLPALIFWQEKHWKLRTDEPRPAWAHWLSSLEERYLAYPRLVVVICALFTIFCLSLFPRVKFDYNLINLQSQTLPSVQTELKLLNGDHQGTLFGVSMTDTPQQAVELAERMKKLPSVSNSESVAPLIPTDYAAKVPYLLQLQKIMAGVPLPNPNGPVGGATGNNLIKMGEGFKLLDSTFKKELPALMASKNPKVRQQAAQFKALLKKLFATLQGMGPGPIADGVDAFQHDLFSDLRGVIDFLKSQRATPSVTFDMLPKSVRLRGIGITGKILVRTYPKYNPWDRQRLGEFLHEIQGVDPDVIGAPVMVYHHTEALRQAYQTSGWYAFGAIVLILLLHFRRVDRALLAVLPKVIGVIWMVGIMGLFHKSFNPANFMALPLILGIGLIFGVHVVHRLLQSPHEGVFSHSTGPAIALSASTTMCGFGTLMMAKHQGIASLGFLMTVGVGASLITSLVLLPAVMRLLVKPQPAVLDSTD